MTEPVRFGFGLHLHQPVGNFDSVFEQHVADVYRPLIEALDQGGAWPVSLHVSGPLLDWLEAHAARLVDQIGRLVADGKIELLLAGYDEPILAVLPREDRLEQIGRMGAALSRRFGVHATGLWLTERVWEPDLAFDLAAAGVRYVLVDDRHFLVAGFERAALHRPFTTEAGGRSVTVFPIDERLRYLVPFRPPSELADYLTALHRAGAPMAVLADDGEKFGGWPGTREWVYGSGWMTDFTTTLRRLTDDGVARLATFGEIADQVSSGGLAYLPSASYREMEGWALPAPQAIRLKALEESLGEARVHGPDGALIRGSHWRHFLAKYSESNRMHKKMLSLSRLCRERGDPADARRAIGRAQCNDAYWHGVFGGLYLPHLRDGVWRELARAEGMLRVGEGLAIDSVDLDCDGQREWWIHSAAFSALVAPHRGGGIEEWTSFATLGNFGNTLTRRREGYHDEAVARGAKASPAAGSSDQDGTASIHALEEALRLDDLPPVDRWPRAIGLEAVVGEVPSPEGWADGRVAVARDWGGAAGGSTATMIDGQAVVVVQMDRLTKTVTFDAGGSIRIEYQWDATTTGTWFTSELSLAGDVAVTTDGTARWEYDIETVAKSERGFDRTKQGRAVVVGWPVAAGRGWATLRPK